jgi:hypothetical protein
MILFTFFGFSHSFLASSKIKSNIIKNIGKKIAFYRLFYNVTSIIIFIALLYILPRPSLILYDLEFPYDIVIFVIQILGLLGVIWSAGYFDLAEFFGIKQIVRYLNDEYCLEDKDEKKFFEINGPLKFSRHPIYFFIIVFLSARPSMNLFYLTLLICIISYFYIGSIYEEKKLVEEFGDQYIIYKNNVPKIVPYKFWNIFIKRKR